MHTKGPHPGHHAHKSVERETNHAQSPVRGIAEPGEEDLVERLRGTVTPSIEIDG